MKQLYYKSKTIYDPMKHGAVVAIRIYYEGDRSPMAEIITAFGYSKTIAWTHVDSKKEFECGINGYTLFYDEREKCKFEDWNNFDTL